MAAPGVTPQDGHLRVTDEQRLLHGNARLTLKRPSSPAVVISPSQLGVYDQCRRKWAWENVAGMRSPPTPSQILGTRVHAVFEAWLKHGTPPDRKTLEGRIALMGLPQLPPPGVGEVERQFYLTTRSGYHYTGIADWMGWHPELGAMVIDHKTTSAMRWAKTKEELEFDVQALLYAIFACISMQTDRVTLRWNYVQTNAKAARLVEATLHLGQIIERFPIVERRAAEMTAHRQAKTHPLRVLPNPLACADFGGCPHQQRCNLSPTEKMEAIMANEQNGTMREHMQSLTNYRPPNAEGVFPPPPGPPLGAAPAYPVGVAPVTAYLPPGPTQLEAPQAYAAPAQQAPAPGYVNYAPQAFTPPAPETPATNVNPFWQHPLSGHLVDATTGEFLPQHHPAYQYPASYRQYQVAPPAQIAPPPLGGAGTQLGGVGTMGPNGAGQYPPVGGGAPGGNFPMPQGAPTAPGAPGGSLSINANAQYPNYTPNAGPNAPEQHADPAQIPAPIATPALHVEGVTDAPKKRGRRTKAEIEAATLAAGGPTALAMQQASRKESDTGDLEHVFIGAVNAFLANPSNTLITVTVEQLVYIGNLACAAFQKQFGG
jgi:hypothetical protein